MAVDAKDFRRFGADYFAVTGRVAQGFVCPITMEDVPLDELCAGHILNAAIKSASRRVVPQRASVDNYFGHTVEPDLIRFVNFPVTSPAERVRRSRRLLVTAPSGEKVEAFFAGPEAGKRFQQISLLADDGKIIASPYLRDARLEEGTRGETTVEYLEVFHNTRMTAALLKAAYLTVFSMIGYGYVFDSAGSRVRQALEAYYRDSAGKDDTDRYFADFAGAKFVVLGGSLAEASDTLEGGLFTFHYADTILKRRLLCVPSGKRRELST